MTVAFCHSDRESFFSREKLLQNDSGVLSFRQRKFLQSRKALSEWQWRIVIPTEKVSSVAKSSFRMTVGYCHSDRESFFSREKLLQNDSGVLSFRASKDSSVTKSSFRMTVACCHSDREAVLASTRNLFVITTSKDSSVAKSSFRMTLGYCYSDRQRFFSREKLLQNDSGLLSFRQAKILQSRKASSEWQWRIVIPTEKLFLLRRGIYLSFRQAKILQSRKAPSEWQWPIVIPTGKDSSVAKSSFRMTVAFCHSDARRNLFITFDKFVFISQLDENT